MSPIEKLNAAAARLIQESASLRGPQEVRLREIAAIIRGATATIRTALEGNERRPAHPKFALLTGDEPALAAINGRIAAGAAMRDL